MTNHDDDRVDKNTPLLTSSEADSETMESYDSSISSLTEQWTFLNSQQRRLKFNELTRTEAEELFLNLKTKDQADLIEELTHLEKRSWVRLLAPDDIADLIQELGAKHKDEIINLLDPQTRREVIVLLAYAEDDAGGLMSPRFIRLRENMNVDEAISYIRIQSRTQVETIYYAYVLNIDQVLLGVVTFRELFAAAPNQKITDIMHTDIIKIPADLDQEQAARIFSQHDFMALPVISEQGKMVGIVTFDDIASVIQEEATEDIHKLGAVESLNASYLESSISEMIKKRVGWLMVLFIGQMFTASAMGYYEDELHRAAVLTLFLPLIISSGGNSGSQASTLIIRAIALEEIKLKDWWKILRRELIIGGSLGLILGLLGLLRIYFWPWAADSYGPHYQMIAVTVAASVIGVVLWGTLAGAMLPFLLKRLNLDPASASAPAVSTVVDVTGLIVYFSTATFLLKGILL